MSNQLKSPNKIVWIINQYATTPELGFGGRSFYLGCNLAKSGHKVTIIASSANHLLRKPVHTPNAINLQSIEDLRFAWVRLGNYKNARSAKRVWNWFRFAYELGRMSVVLREKPDVVICSSPSLVSWLGAEWLSKKTAARIIFEVRDIWPLTLIELGGFSRLNPFILFLQWIERRAYKLADAVVSNIPHADLHMVGKGMVRSKFLWLPNGIDTEEFETTRPVPESVQAALPKDKFVVGYAGTHGAANALQDLIEAAKLLKADNNIHFVLVGDGGLKADLIRLVESADLKNVSFVDSIAKRDIPATLSSFDACFIGAHRSPLYRFGVAMNKLPEYMMAAKPIIYAIESGEYRPIEQARCGVEVKPGDPNLLASKIKALSQTSAQERRKMGERARAFACRHHDYSKITVALEDVFEPH